MTNPVKTVWWETYQLWDEVLHQVGKAYYKARPPKRGSRSVTESRPALPRSQQMMDKVFAGGGSKLQTRQEHCDMPLVRQRSNALHG
ncbi:hypothetical protein DHEL01_v210178 [Diaporthe helianthi]|uniref:Uncharacterized protein n=1 Tax=Diaporthe helianthi TaxID=158607 RepID=A0A2P5HMF9_DIAHE|nr:hypothetical protein DHEL01_v210178 [Diaporthe helianthi]